MKFLIIIVSLLVSSEVQFILCDDSNNNTIELKPSGQNGQRDTGSQIRELVPEDKSKMPPDSYSSNQEMRIRATDKYTQIYENAASALKKVQTKVENFKEEATTEKDTAIKKCQEQYNRAESILVIIEERMSKKFTEAQKNTISEYNHALEANNEKLKKAAEARDIAYEAAEIEFEKVRQKIEENKQKLESEHQETLEKALKEREMTLEVANTNTEKAKEIYAKAIKSKIIMSPDEKEKLRDKLEEEIDEYEEAVEMANDKWQTVLDTFGIGKEYEEALDKALKELEEAEQKADLILKDIEDEEDKVLKEVKKKKLQAESLANAERVKGEGKCEEIQKQNDFQFDICLQKARRQWRKKLKPADDELRKANREFDEVKSKAQNELRQTLEKADEIERKLAEANKSNDNIPEKIIGVRNQRNWRSRRIINK